MSLYSGLLLLLFMSGACSLVYELIWVRMLLVVFGVSTYAVSTVLTAFMAGLAIGSLYFGRVADRWSDDRPETGLKVYGLLELGIGLFAILFPTILSGLDEVYTLLYAVAGESASFPVLRFLLTAVVLVIPTTLMGATLPVLCKFAIRRVEGSGAGVGRLYAINTLGAAVGCFIAAFVLLPHLGVAGATYLVAAGNFAIGGIALLLSRKHAQSTEKALHAAEAESEGVTASVSAGPVPTWVPALILAGMAVSGFAALGYEVVWTRLLHIVNKTTTTQSFSAILMAFLVGIAVGGAIGSRIADRQRDPVLSFGILEVAIGVFGLGSVLLLAGVPDYLAILGEYFELAYTTDLFLAGVVVMLIPTCLMGIAFPLAARLQITGMARIGRSVGDVYAANTAGAIAGAFCAGFVLIPMIGTQATVYVFAWANVAMGVALVLASPLSGRNTKLSVAGVAAALVLVVQVAIPSNLFIQLFERLEPNGRLLHFSEDAGGTVTVHDLPEQRSLRVNGTGEVRTDFAALQTFRMLGNLPMLLHGAAEEVVVIAFGGGMSLAAAETHAPKLLQCVEVVPGVFDAAKYFAKYNNSISERFDTPQLQLISGDGRNHLLRTDRRYDVIIADATHPTTADSWLLYTEEFYRLCHNRLDDDGIMAQWVPTHGLSVEEYRMVLRTFQTVFPHTSVWLNEIYTIVVGTPGPMRVELSQLERSLSRRPVQANLAAVEIGDPLSLLSLLAMDELAVARYTGRGRINTDGRAYVGYLRESVEAEAAPHMNGSEVLHSMTPFLVRSPHGWLTGKSRDSALLAKLEKRLEARVHSVAGIAEMLTGDRRSAQLNFWRAQAIDPGEISAQRLLEVIGTGE
jgi:spermidine synthase